MIVKLNYDDMKGDNLSVTVGKTVRKPNIIMRVNQSNIEDAIVKFNNSVSAFLYTDSIESLQQFKTLKMEKVRIEISADPSDDDIVDRLSVIPAEYTVIMKLPNNYSDMRVLSTLSAMFPNLRYCGGMICNIAPIRLGCIDDRDVDKTRKQFFYVNTCCCIEKPEYLDDLEYEFTDKPVKEKSSSAKVRSKLPSYIGLGGINNF